MSKITLNMVGSLIDTTTAATTINNNSVTVQSAFDNTLSRDGTNPNQMGSNLDMNSHRIINVSDGLNNTDAITLEQLNSVTIPQGNIPSGGTTGQVLTKLSNTNLNYTWSNPATTAATKGVFGGRLTTTAGKPKILTDATSSTLWYSPYTGDSINVQGSLVNFLSGPTDQNGWSLNISGLTTGQYHVCANSSGLYTIPFATTLVRYTGYLSDPANNNPYLGSINVSTAGQITCHVSADYNRKWELWNNYNKLPVTLTALTQERDTAYNPRNQYPAFQAFNNNTNNCANVFTGQPEDMEIDWRVQTYMDSLTGSYGITTAIGWNTVANSVGRWGGGSIDESTFHRSVANTPFYKTSAALGANIIYMLVAAAVNSATTFPVIDSSETPSAGHYEAGRNNVMYARWLG